jgi:hypothetical protein
MEVELALLLENSQKEISQNEKSADLIDRDIEE